jgi:thiol-disulfide isomerase/thioredoxin
MMICVVLALIVGLWTTAPASAEAEQTDRSPWYQMDDQGALRVNLYLFWSMTCPHCHRALRFLEELADELPWLYVHQFELSDPATVRTYQAFAKAFDIETAYVPAFFYCGQTSNGYSDDQTTGTYLRDTLKACYAELQANAGASADLTKQPSNMAPQQPISVPLIGELDPASLSLPVMTVLLGGLDAFNPCAFFVLLFLLSLMVHVRKRGHMAIVGGTFVLFSGLLYFLFMAAWLNVFLIIGHLALVTTVAGLIAVAIGAVNIKDYVWFKRGVSLSIPERAKPGLFQRMRGLVATSNLPSILIGTITLALAANAYELLCTAGFPMVFTRILTLNELSPATHYLYLALYNVVYILPLLAIVVVFVVTLGARKLSEDEGRILKLLSGLMMFGLGFVLLVAPDLLSQPLIAIVLMMAALIVTACTVWWRRAGSEDSKPAEEGS